MARNWTPAQLSAMNTRGRTLLISAAAGSGKTATLTERIIRRIMDPENPIQLSRLLIVTFTKAAAAELKQRISKALSDAIAADPGNSHLQNQLIHLGNAHISTIDAFCYQPVKEHFAESGMPASFRIADDAETLPLRQGIMQEIIDEFYEKYANHFKDQPDDQGLFSILQGNPFADLCDSLSSFKNDDNLFDTFNKLYNDLLNFPEGIERLKIEAERLRDHANGEFFLSDHGKLLWDWTKTFADSAYTFFRSALAEILDDPAAEKAYSASFTSEYQFSEALQAALASHSYENTRRVIHGFVAQGLKACRNPLGDYTELKKQRTKLLKDLDEFRSEFYASPTEVLASDMRRMAEMCHVLYDFLNTFDIRLTDEKKLRGICDFSDNRRRLLAMLMDADGRPTPLCNTYLEDYDEVYIDEYQDVDEVQDTIFRLIGGDHRFMVGDIKQSIYGFRGADPTVFAGYRKRLPALSEGESPSGNSIFMSDNFRCDESVIRVTNGVCSHIFSACPESIAYRPEDDLGFSKPCPEGYVPPKVHIGMISAAGKNQEKGPFSSNEAEAVYVANQIAILLNDHVKLADGSEIQPKDIAILMRDSLHMSTYLSALVAMGIPTVCDEIDAAEAAKDLLHGTDMIYLLNLLRVINHPNDDIALSELLRCDFPGLSLDQLITLRQYGDASASLYESLTAFAHTTDGDDELLAKTLAFIHWIEKYRTLSTTLDAKDMLNLLRRDDRVACRKSNAFQYLYESARTCRVAPFVGIYTFLKFFENKILTTKNVNADNGNTKPGGVVSLMTIHHSKGLEFPVCFVVRCGNAKRDKLSSADMVFEKNVGVSLKFFDREKHKKFDNSLRKIAAMARLHQEKEEEMRVLYVAMTRARERLYLTGFSSDTRVPFPDGDRYSALTATTYMEWIKSGLRAHPEIQPFCEVFEIAENSIDRAPIKLGETGPEDDDHNRELMERYRYLQSLRCVVTPLDEMLRSVPISVPASRMSPLLLDQCVFYNSDLPVGDEDKLPFSERGLPIFDAQSIANIERSLDLMSSSHGQDEFELLLKSNTRPTAAEKGTAAHLFLQYCDWGSVFSKGLEEEIARLRTEGFISERVEKILDKKQLTAYFDSDFVKKASSATHMERELKFHRFIPLRELTSDPELAKALEERTLYVRGSIDLLCEYEDGRIEICDYKTDHVTKEERDDPALLVSRLKEKHGPQLLQYALAVEERYHRKPDAVYIFSLPLGKAIEIKIDDIKAV